MMMYYSVSRFVYAHFIVAIFDSCCMDENNNKKIWIKLFDLLMQLCLFVFLILEVNLGHAT